MRILIQNMADPISHSRKQGRARNFTGTEQIQGVNIFAFCLDQIWANCKQPHSCVGLGYGLTCIDRIPCLSR
jgi:hypothetical protein